MNADPLLNGLLTDAPPYIAEQTALDIVREHYGVIGAVERLGGERDGNFHIRADDGRDYVLKISSASEAPEITNFNTEELLHIARRDPEIPVQRMVAARDGRYELALNLGAAAPLTTRLLTYLDGVPLYRVARSQAQRRAAGRLLARLDLALADFTHPVASQYELLWDMKHLSRLAPLLDAVEPGAPRALVQAVFDREADVVAPRRASLRWQVIHNDLNPHNLLVASADQDAVSGILDFGDSVYTPLIHDLAVACSYHIPDGGHPLADAAEFAAAYHAVLPLMPNELDLLFDLIKMRLATTIIITSWRARRYPEHSAYILRNNPLSWAGLRRLDSITASAARDVLARACGAA